MKYDYLPLDYVKNDWRARFKASAARCLDGFCGLEISLEARTRANLSLVVVVVVAVVVVVVVAGQMKAELGHCSKGEAALSWGRPRPKMISAAGAPALD